MEEREDHLYGSNVKYRLWINKKDENWVGRRYQFAIDATVIRNANDTFSFLSRKGWSCDTLIWHYHGPNLGQYTKITSFSSIKVNEFFSFHENRIFEITFSIQNHKTKTGRIFFEKLIYVMLHFFLKALHSSVISSLVWVDERLASLLHFKWISFGISLPPQNTKLFSLRSVRILISTDWDFFVVLHSSFLILTFLPF